MLIINDVNILKKYPSVTLLAVETIDCTVSNNVTWIGGIKPIANITFSNGTIDIKLLVEGDKILVGKIIADMQGGKLIHKAEHYNLVSLINVEDTFITEDVYEVVLKYSSSFKMKDEVNVELINRDIEFINEGTVDSYGRIELTSNGTSCSVFLNDQTFSFNNIKNGDKIILEAGVIAINGANGIDKVELRDFPKIISGVNSVQMNNCVGVIKYNPTFL